MHQSNSGICKKCRAIVPAQHVFRDSKVFLRKECPDCGPDESLLSNDATAWQHKREMLPYESEPHASCSMQCRQCGVQHNPTLVFVDVTNRCNMNCPICIANVHGMGFVFDPPLEYFQKVFQALGKLDPKPVVELFGGEPTVREDLLDIIRIARDNGVKARVVTNGIRLADEDYCRKLCEVGVRFRLALDGRSPEIYRRLRQNPSACEKKLRALANLKKYSRRKNALLCCAARNINENYIGDLIECCHENKEVIDTLGLLPLSETWEPGTFETDVQTTREDVEHMVEQSVPGGQVEFIPAGLMHHLRRARSFMKGKSRASSDFLIFGGVHPDCETMALLASDGKHYRSINHYLKLPFSRVVEEMRARALKIDPKLGRLNPAKRFDRWRAKYLLLRTYVPLAIKAIAIRRVFRGNPAVVLLRMLGGIIGGRKASDVARQYLNLSEILRVAILPFEEYHAIDAARLETCKAVFAYEDVEDGTIKMIPACVWGSVYRNDVLRKISAKYSSDRAAEGKRSPHGELCPS